MDFIGIIVLALIWGASFLFIKVGLNGGMSPVLVATMRLAFGAALLWLFVLVRLVLAPRSFKKPIPHDRATWRKLLVIGLFNNAIPFALISWGEQRISSGLASVFNSTMPLFTVIFAHFLTHDDRITPMKAIGVCIGFIGVGVVIAPSASDLTGELLGCLAVIIASASYSIATVYIKNNLTRSTDPIATGAGQLLMGFVWLLPLLLITGATANLTSIPVASLVAVMVLGILGTGIAYLIYFLLIQHAKASQMSLVTYLLPITALVYGTWFLKEPVNLYALAGFVLIVAGILFVNRANQIKPQSISADSAAPTR